MRQLTEPYETTSFLYSYDNKLTVASLAAKR